MGKKTFNKITKKINDVDTDVEVKDTTDDDVYKQVAELYKNDNENAITNIDNTYNSSVKAIDDNLKTYTDTLKSNYDTTKGLYDTSYNNQLNNLESQYNTDLSALDTQRKNQLNENDIMMARIMKYLPQQLKGAGLSGVGYNEQTILNANNNAMALRNQINQDYNTNKNNYTNQYNQNKNSLESDYSENIANLLNEYNSNVGNAKNDANTNKTNLLSEYNANKTNLNSNYADKIASNLYNQETAKQNAENNKATESNNLLNYYMQLFTGTNYDDVLNGAKNSGISDSDYTMLEDYLKAQKNAQATATADAIIENVGELTEGQRKALNDSIVGATDSEYYDENIVKEYANLSEEDRTRISNAIANAEVENYGGTGLSASLKGMLGNKHIDENDKKEDWFKIGVQLGNNYETLKLKIDTKNIISSTSEQGQKMIKSIEKSKNGASVVEGDLCYYNGQIYVVGNKGNLCKVNSRGGYQDDYDTLLKYFKK